MKYRKLGNTGLDVSVISFGASSLGSVFHPTDDREAERTVHTAFELGINYFDAAPYYGLLKAERVLGQSLKSIPRDRYILSTKAGRYGEADFDFSYDRILRSAEESMTRLHTDYLDILFLHDIEFGDRKQIVEEALPALEELKKQGKIRFTGVSGLPLSVFRTVLEHHKVDAILSYCHYSLNDDALLDLLPLLRETGTALVNASPLSMGLLSGTEPPAWHPANPFIREVCREASTYCEQHGLSLPKLAIQFAVNHEEIPTTLVSTAEPEKIRRNIESALEPPDLKAIEAVRRVLQPIQRRSWPSGRPEYHTGVLT
ncbi:aldo/keto reductase [Paenibacillus mucilaginosus]|uniref:Aldo/keto reductase n=1 Tax=Paenibacillus mucilaginosus (strain KNP414) TaxID=1036673 RepID=F8FDV6_PAEMK|nr:aldo/keto reductase [Paenibacillus mucilaginosus]AEI43156.1 aldo/keto reductase [Paenibacillus mucilaginosus KNP414]MCG7212279.1 aldo/keto reductase [Paenibacillus mucilaginosus]WDM24760.1 aldo/keto reductase [Paenibacillus mucilaginosus]